MGGGGKKNNKDFDFVDDVILFPKKIYDSVTNTELTEARGADPTNEMLDQDKQLRRKQLAENKDLDEESRKELLGKFDSNEDITQLYQQALDPENKITKDRKRRQAAAAIERDQPGLNKQTSYLGAGSGGPSSFLGGGSR